MGKTVPGKGAQACTEKYENKLREQVYNQDYFIFSD